MLIEQIRAKFQIRLGGQKQFSLIQFQLFHETTEIELMKTVFAHPTLSETLHESVLSAYDKAIHI